MNTLKNLEWKTCSRFYPDGLEISETRLYSYILKPDKDMFKVYYYDIENCCNLEETGFATIVCAKKWCFKNFENQMKPYINYP